MPRNSRDTRSLDRVSRDRLSRDARDAQPLSFANSTARLPPKVPLSPGQAAMSRAEQQRSNLGVSSFRSIDLLSIYQSVAGLTDWVTGWMLIWLQRHGSAQRQAQLRYQS